MHYSIIPYDTVFSAPLSGETAQTYQTMVYRGVKMDVSRGQDGTYTIKRLYSTDPKVYLKKDLQVGTRITISPYENEPFGSGK